MKKRILTFFMLTLIFTGCKNSQVKEPEKKTINTVFESSEDYLKKYNYSLSLNDAINIARERNLQYLTKKLESDIATLDRKIAFGNFLPSVNAGMSYTRTNDSVDLETGVDVGPISTSDLQIMDKESHSFGIGAQIPIFVPSLWYLYSARKKGEKISGMIESLADKKIQLLVMNEYYTILSLEDSIKNLNTQVESATSLLEEASVALEVESINKWELGKARVNLKEKKLLLNKNQRNLDIARMRLMETLNLNPFTKFELKRQAVKVEKDNLTLQDAVLEALNNNDMIKITDKNSEISDDKVKVAITNFLPKVIAGTGYVNTSNSVYSDPDFLYGNVSGMVSIFNGFKNINEYKKAKKRKKISQLKLEEEFLKTIIETAKAYKQLQNINEYYSLTNTNLNSEILKIEQNKNEYELGIINQSNYLKDVSEYEKSRAIAKRASYLQEISKGLLNITMGNYPLEKKGEKKSYEE